ncbi:hypothetical protein [Alteraurantiacibacter aquimixticola]|uniref:Uncharacterized protein n=1 Tax=Alteraurantiacibacter aquimixticola TaxID=2489173 RepID=A0A4V4U8X1_9SPHN|nr:hypothetical protein [Alteraurantiacibacter aquimixticola]TIX51657.1 hypothetical protein E5222_04185 [Alteraurantiacibacter aquimixticola]
MGDPLFLPKGQAEIGEILRILRCENGITLLLQVDRKKGDGLLLAGAREPKWKNYIVTGEAESRRNACGNGMSFLRGNKLLSDKRVLPLLNAVFGEILPISPYFILRTILI